MSHIATTQQSRRSFLRAGGALIALPFLETFASAKQLASSAPRRLVFLGGGYGFTHESFYPKKAGAFSKIGLTKGLEPLREHMQDVTLVSNLHNPKITDPHAGTAGYLSGSKLKVSCDQVAAQQFGDSSRFASLVLTSRGDNSGHGSGGISLSSNLKGDPIAGIKRPLDFIP